MLEKEIERALGARLKALGCLYLKFASPATRGVPDRIVICPDGHVVFAELKREDGVLSPQQDAMIRALRQRGQDTRVIRGMAGARVFLEDVEARVKAKSDVGDGSPCHTMAGKDDSENRPR